MVEDHRSTSGTLHFAQPTGLLRMMNSGEKTQKKNRQGGGQGRAETKGLVVLSFEQGLHSLDYVGAAERATKRGSPAVARFPGGIGVRPLFARHRGPSLLELIRFIRDPAR